MYNLTTGRIILKSLCIFKWISYSAALAMQQETGKHTMWDRTGHCYTFTAFWAFIFGTAKLCSDHCHCTLNVCECILLYCIFERHIGKIHPLSHLWTLHNCMQKCNVLFHETCTPAVLLNRWCIYRLVSRCYP